MPRVELTELQIMQRDQFRNQTKEDLPHVKHKAAVKDAWEKALDKMSDPEACAAKHKEYLDSLEARGVPFHREGQEDIRGNYGGKVQKIRQELEEHGRRGQQEGQIEIRRVKEMKGKESARFWKELC